VGSSPTTGTKPYGVIDPIRFGIFVGTRRAKPNRTVSGLAAPGFCTARLCSTECKQTAKHKNESHHQGRSNLFYMRRGCAARSASRPPSTKTSPTTKAAVICFICGEAVQHGVQTDRRAQKRVPSPALQARILHPESRRRFKARILRAAPQRFPCHDHHPKGKRI
jgi:hypothetical protein